MKQVNVIMLLQNKNKTHSQTQLYFKKNITFIKSYTFQVIPNHHQAFVQNLC